MQRKRMQLAQQCLEKRIVDADIDRPLLTREKEGIFSLVQNPPFELHLGVFSRRSAVDRVDFSEVNDFSVDFEFQPNASQALSRNHGPWVGSNDGLPPSSLVLRYRRVIRASTRILDHAQTA